MKILEVLEEIINNPFDLDANSTLLSEKGRPLHSNDETIIRSYFDEKAFAYEKTVVTIQA